MDLLNIMLNEVCNLKCDYCFANEFVDEKKKDHLKSQKHIKLKDFKEIVDFITKTSDFLGLIGGEPTLHPEIKKF